MTKEETAERIKVMQAYVDGKTIEFFNEANNKWEVCEKPLWTPGDTYRVKPERKYRPFKSADEAFQEAKKHGFWMYSVNDKYYESIVNIPCHANIFLSRDEMISYVELVKYFVWADTNEPCGILEE